MPFDRGRQTDAVMAQKETSMTKIGISSPLPSSRPAVAAVAGPVASQTAAPTTVVLVHGAFADGSSWSEVIPLLQAAGLNVVAVQNPLTSLADDVAATRRAIDMQKGPIVLVGHSWAGTVITEAGDDERVKALVYVAAFAPAPGETTNELGQGLSPASGARQPDRRCLGLPDLVSRDGRPSLRPGRVAGAGEPDRRHPGADPRRQLSTRPSTSPPGRPSRAGTSSPNRTT